MSNIREYQAEISSTDTFGRMLGRTRDQHMVVDGPVWNGCPGEAWTPGELFLAGVAACGVEQLQMFAAEEGLALNHCSASVHGWVDRDNPVRPDRTLFNGVELAFRLGGVSEAQSGELIEKFKGRCPLFGTVATACDGLTVTYTIDG